MAVLNLFPSLQIFTIVYVLLSLVPFSFLIILNILIFRTIKEKTPAISSLSRRQRVDMQTWKKFLAFWESELRNQNPSADFLRNIRYKKGIMKICNHYSILQKEFILPAAEILL